MKARVLVINWQDWTHPLAGGAEVHLREIFRRLARRGWHVTLLVCSFPGAARREVLEGVTILRTGPRSTFNFCVPWVYRKLAARCPFDLVVDDLNKIPFFSPLFARVPVVGLVHHFFDRSIFRETWALPAAYVYLMERFVAPVYRRCWFGAVSESTREDLVRRGIPRGRVMLVPNAIDIRKYGPDECARAAHPVVGYFGRLKRYKSVDHLLRAFQIVRREISDAELIIVGEGDDRPRLQRLARRLGLNDRVTFTGWVREEDKIHLLRRMWVCVNPSPREGWGLTVTEANACGTPVVAANSPGLRDSVRPGVTGFLYPYGDVRVMAERLLTLLRDSDLRTRMGIAAYQWACEQSWDAATDRAELLLCAALEKRN